MWITLELLSKACPGGKDSRLELFVDPLRAACDEFAINTMRRQAAFVAQLAHECGSFKFMREIWGPTPAQKRYDSRADLGNTKPAAIEIAQRHGDTPGHFWRGRGGIQITGYDNYLAVEAALGIECLESPVLLEEPMGAMRSAAWFWKAHGLNELADELRFELITRRINGGLNGYDDRLKRYGLACSALDIEPSAVA